MIDLRFKELADRLSVLFEKLENQTPLTDEEKEELKALKTEINKMDIYDIISDSGDTD